MAEDRKEMMDDDLDMIEDMADLQEASLFWSLKVPANGTVEIDQPAVPEYIVSVTHACFGASMKKGSRSVLLCQTGESEEFVPVCVLNSNHCENVNLDLLFNETATFKVEGNKASDIHLTGYLRPGFDSDEPSPYDDAAMMNLEDFEDEDMDVSREDTNDIAPILIDENEESSMTNASKKRKLNGGQAKPTANGNKNDNNNNKRKSPKNKPAASPKTENNNNDNKNNKNKNKNKKNKKSPKQKPVTADTKAVESEAAAKKAEEATATPPASAAEQGKKKKNKKSKKKKMGV